MAKKLTQAYLERAAFHYLGRYASSAANLARVLRRKVKRRLDDGEEIQPEYDEWIAAVVEKCIRLNYINDRDYARMKARSMSRAGKAKGPVSAYLRHKGVSGQDIEDALGQLDREMDDKADWFAAVAYARRRRFGPFRTADADEDKKRRELASMLRAGHRFELAREIITATSSQVLEMTPDEE